MNVYLDGVKKEGYVGILRQGDGASIDIIGCKMRWVTRILIMQS